MYVAFKEIGRSLGRFTLLSLAVALLVILLLFFQAVAGTLTSGLTGGLESTSADVLVYDLRARRNPATSLIPARVLQEVGKVAGVAAVSPIALSVFIGTTNGAQIDVQLGGGDPTGPSMPADISEGRLPQVPGEALFSGSAFDDPIEIGEAVMVEGLNFEIVGTADGAAFNVLPTLYVAFDDFANASQSRAGVPIEVSASLLGVRILDEAGCRGGDRDCFHCRSAVSNPRCLWCVTCSDDHSAECGGHRGTWPGGVGGCSSQSARH